MYPILFKLGPITLYSYGLFVALGVLAGIKVIDLESIRNKWNQELMTRLTVMTFFMGLLGGRIMYVITQIGTTDIMTTLLDPHAGFVFYGGLIASWSFIYWQAKKRKMKLWAVLDAFALAVCIAEGIGRFGCLLGGCCYGKACDLPWGVIMVNEPKLGHVHPTQAYEGIILIILFFILWARSKKKKYLGESVVAFVGSYAVIRYIIELYRGDTDRGYVIENILSTSQAISIGMIIFVIVIHLKRSKIKIN